MFSLKKKMFLCLLDNSHPQELVKIETWVKCDYSNVNKKKGLGILISGNVELYKSMSIKLLFHFFIPSQMHKVDPSYSKIYCGRGRNG